MTRHQAMALDTLAAREIVLERDVCTSRIGRQLASVGWVLRTETKPVTLQITPQGRAALDMWAAGK